LGLGLEAGPLVRAGMRPGQDHLQRDHAVQGQVPRLVDDAHAAAAQLAEHLVAGHAGPPCFFSLAAWSLVEARPAWARARLALFGPTGLTALAVGDPLCRKRGLTIFGTGMHHDPLISSRAKALVRWGHDGVVLCLLVRCPWAPGKVWGP